MGVTSEEAVYPLGYPYLVYAPLALSGALCCLLHFCVSLCDHLPLAWKDLAGEF